MSGSGTTRSECFECGRTLRLSIGQVAALEGDLYHAVCADAGRECKGDRDDGRYDEEPPSPITGEGIWTDDPFDEGDDAYEEEEDFE